MRRVFILVLGGFLASMAYAAKRADEIYTAGPETLTARATKIVAGPVSAYSKRVLSTSEPPGPDAIPLKWIIAGRVDNPKPLKGPATGAVSFTRAEHSALIADTVDVPSWELAYGDLRQSGQVVLFLGSDPENDVIQAVPSADGELDLASLVRDIVAIQSNPGNGKLKAWLAYLGTARNDHGREAALRSLVQMNADWKRMRPTLDRFMGNPSLSQHMCGFGFGIVVFGLTNQKWEQDQVSVADFLGRQFEIARTPKLAFQYILSLKMALRYTMEEAARGDREPIRKQIIDGLRRNEPVASRTPEVAEQYRQIRATYPSLF